MQIQTVQIVAGLVAAIAFIIAFISAGVAVISAVFALIGASAIAWLVYTVAKRMLLHRAERNVTPAA